MTEDKLHGLLGLSMRAGRLAVGTDQALNAGRRGTAAALLVDAGASDNTKKKLHDFGAFRQLPVFELPEGLMDRALGQEGRMAAAALRGPLADQIIRLLQAG